MRRLMFLVLMLGILGLWLWSDRWAPPETVQAASARVRDGDTIDLAGRIFRLHGIDAPEYRQTCTDSAGREWPCGKAARLQLAAMLASGSLSCEVQAKDKYAREVARCASATVADLSKAMVEAGLAISPAERGDAPYAEEEEAARAAKRGLWQGAFETPADWRTLHVRGEG